jgi:hypothetical protein
MEKYGISDRDLYEPISKWDVITILSKIQEDENKG